MSTLFAWNIIYLVSGFLLLVIAFILHRNIGLFPPTKSENYAKTIRSLPLLLVIPMREASSFFATNLPSLFLQNTFCLNIIDYFTSLNSLILILDCSCVYLYRA